MLIQPVWLSLVCTLSHVWNRLIPKTVTTALWFNLAIILPARLGLSRSGRTHAVIFTVMLPGGSGAAGVAGAAGTFVGAATFGVTFCVAALAAVAGFIGAWKAANPKRMATMTVNKIDCFIRKFSLLGTVRLNLSGEVVTD